MPTSSHNPPTPGQRRAVALVPGTAEGRHPAVSMRVTCWPTFAGSHCHTNPWALHDTYLLRNRPSARNPGVLTLHVEVLSKSLVQHILLLRPLRQEVVTIKGQRHVPSLKGTTTRCTNLSSFMARSTAFCHSQLACRVPCKYPTCPGLQTPRGVRTYILSSTATWKFATRFLHSGWVSCFLQ